MKNQIPILCYHRICPVQERQGSLPALCVTPQQFAAQLRLLKFLGYQTVSAQSLTAYYNGLKNLPPKTVLLTFDDGYADNYTYALPLLKKFGFTATIFLVTDRIGAQNDWDKDGAPLLHKDQIQEMLDAGLEFGSHTATHIDMTQTSADQTQQELKRSLECLQQWTLRQDIPFCYPYARTHTQARQWVAQAGYMCAFAGDLGYDLAQNDLFNLMRIQIFNSTSLFQFWKKLQVWFPRWKYFLKTVLR